MIAEFQKSVLMISRKTNFFEIICPAAAQPKYMCILHQLVFFDMQYNAE